METNVLSRPWTLRVHNSRPVPRVLQVVKCSEQNGRNALARTKVLAVKIEGFHLHIYYIRKSACRRVKEIRLHGGVFMDRRVKAVLDIEAGRAFTTDWVL